MSQFQVMFFGLWGYVVLDFRADFQMLYIPKKNEVMYNIFQILDVKKWVTTKWQQSILCHHFMMV